MRVFLSLTVLCLSLASCDGACNFSPLATPDGCIDPFDGSKHPVGSKWNTAQCLECSCGKTGMSCCTRYGGTVSVPGCTAVVDPNTCTYKLHKTGDPSKPCDKA